MAYQCYRTITIDKDKVGLDNTGSLSALGFPVLVSISGTYLKTTDNGGDIESEQGWDIIFTEDDKVTPLRHEIHDYDGVAGTLFAWVKINSLSKSTDTDFIMYYGNSDVSIMTQDITSVWSAYEAAYHFDDDEATSNVFDSGFDNHDGIYEDVGGEINTSTVSDPNGVIRKALTFDGVDNRITVSGTLSPNYITMSAWAKSSSVTKQEIMNDVGDTWHIRIADQGASPPTCIVKVGGEYALAQYSTTQTDGEWHHIAGTWDGNAARVYVDGIEGTPDTTLSGSMDTTDGDFLIGVHANLSSNPMNGSIDELRLSVIPHTHDWIVTEFNNQSSPSTFIYVSESFCYNNKFIQTLGGDPIMGAPLANVGSVMGVPW